MGDEAVLKRQGWRWGARGHLRACAAGASLLLAAAALLAPGRAGAQSWPAMNSYAQPPFVPVEADRAAGLAAVFVEQLNREVRDRASAPQFHLETLPRRRLDLSLRDGAFSGVALFLAPEFLAEGAQREGAWSAPVMIDENLLVSTRPLKAASLDQLEGLRLGGVAGHLYRELAPLVAAGRLAREDAPDHIANLRKLCLGRVDFVVISRSELAGTLPHAPCAQPFLPHAFPEPQVIVRRVLVRMPGEDVARSVLDAVARVSCGERWMAALAGYGLATAGCQRRAAGGAAEPGAPAGKRRAGARR